MKTIITVGFFFLMHSAFSQNYIGMHKDSIKETMRNNQKSFSLDQSTVNKVYKYLKYVDSYGEQTLLYFLNENDYCTSSKLMSDYSNLTDIIDELNNEYINIDDSTWKYYSDNEEYIVTLIEGDWFFTVYTKKKKQE
jgi:hypothetical protein